MRNYLKLGSWNCICDICGFKYKAEMVQKNWKGEMVCNPCYELRHPQDFLRSFPDNVAPPWTRPEGDDVFVPQACYIWEESGYAGLAVAGCMVAGNATFSPAFLLQLKGS